MEDPTSYHESNAILALINEDPERARACVEQMGDHSIGELRLAADLLWAICDNVLDKRTEKAKKEAANGQKESSQG